MCVLFNCFPHAGLRARFIFSLNIRPLEHYTARMKSALAAFFLVSLALGAADGIKRDDKSGEFTYVVPRAWIQGTSPSKHDVFVFRGGDAKIRTVAMVPQPGYDGLEKFKAQLEREYPDEFKDFKLESSAIVKLKNGQEALRFAHTNSQPGHPVRQVTYTLQFSKEKRYVITCTVFPEDGKKYDAMFEEFVNSITLK